MFSEAIQSVGRILGLTPARPPAEDDRRVWERVRCDLDTTCRHAGRADAPPHTIRVHNISGGGVGFSSETPYTPGALVSISLPATVEEADPTHVLACVVRCDPTAFGQRFEVGCTFAGVLDDADLARFGARRVKPEADDKRSWVRYPCHARARFQIVRPPAPSAPNEARVRDISAGGVSLEVDEALAVGDLLSVDLFRDDEFLLTTLASVVRTEPGPDGNQVVGCNFIRELGEEITERLD